jgi:hypothetical protein
MLVKNVIIQLFHGYKLVWHLKLNSMFCRNYVSCSLLTIFRGELSHLGQRLAIHNSPILARKLAKRRLKLQTRIDAFLAKTPTALETLLPHNCPHNVGHSHQHLDEDDELLEDDGLYEDCSQSEEEDNDTNEDIDDKEDEDDTDSEHHIKSAPSTKHVPESIVLPLPSHLGLNNNHDHIAALSQEELTIRQSQASDCLQHLRLSLGMNKE